MLIYGSGGHAKVIVDAAIGSCQQINGIFDDFNNENLLGIPNLGSYDKSKHSSEEIIVGIGDNSLRKNITKTIKHLFGKIIHKGSIISDYSNIDLGTVVFASSVVQANVSIGKHVIVNTGAKIDHDCSVADYCHIAPGAVICGGVTIDEGAFIGAGATVVQGIKIGKWSCVGAGAVVIKDVPDNSIVIGVPAKPKGCS